MHLTLIPCSMVHFCPNVASLPHYMLNLLIPIVHFNLVTSYCALRRKDSSCGLHAQVLHQQKGWDRERWVGLPAG